MSVEQKETKASSTGAPTGLDITRSGLHYRIYVFCFLVIAAALIATGYIFVGDQHARAKAIAHERLAAIADLKQRQLTNWRDERLSDARFFSRAPFVAQDLQRLLAAPGSEPDRDAIMRWLKLLKGGDRYYEVAIYDAQLHPLVTLPTSIPAPAQSERELTSRILKGEELAISDLHEDGIIHMDVMFPIYKDTDLREGLLGFGMLRLDPRHFLYPLIQSWPTPSKTAETLLVERQGDDVVYLNELRNRTATALKFRLPISSAHIAAPVLNGESNVIEGHDYRGVPVVAVGRKIPGTSWAMIAMVDQDELYAPMRRQAFLACMIIATLLLAAALLMALLWRQRANEFLQHELAMQQNRQVERKAYEDELRRMNVELEQRVRERTAQLESKNRELESFAYSVSHDLKAPLRGISGFSNALLEEHLSKLDEDAQLYLTRIVASAERMGQLIDDLLSYSRLEVQAPQWSTVDVCEMVQRIKGDYGAQISETKAQVKVDIKSLPLKTDPHGLEQALRNLIGNAIKFSAKSPAPNIDIIGRDVDGKFTLEVRDNGIGFDMKYAAKLFQIFQRLHSSREYSGTGIGLAIVRKAVERVGGKVSAESEPGKGASFKLEIPRQQPQA